MKQRLQNPLFTERYAEAMVDRVTELEIQKDPLLEDEQMQQLVNTTREKWLNVGREARRLQQDGRQGRFHPVKEYTTGEALYLADTLYLDTVFETEPGPQLHFYLSTVVDPRDVKFPDETAIDLGPLSSPYGAQRYTVPPVEDASLIRVAVLFDKRFTALLNYRNE